MTDSTCQPLQSGYHSALNHRAGMHQWTCLTKLSQIGRNREAAAIVQSFQEQMEIELTAVLSSITPASERAA